MDENGDVEITIGDKKMRLSQRPDGGLDLLGSDSDS